MIAALALQNRKEESSSLLRLGVRPKSQTTRVCTHGIRFVSMFVGAVLDIDGNPTARKSCDNDCEMPLVERTNFAKNMKVAKGIK